MTIITAGSKKFKGLIEASQRQAKKYGYPILVYNLRGLGFGIPFKASFRKTKGIPIIKNLWKPTLLIDAYKRIKDKMVWLDGDAVLWNSIDEVKYDFDIGVTLRRQSEIESALTPQLTGYLNSGVVFINHTKKALEFLKEWEECCKTAFTDQQAITVMISEVTGWTKYNTVIKRKGVRIKIFTTDKYNCYYFKEKLNSTDNRILHFKGDIRGVSQEFIKP